MPKPRRRKPPNAITLPVFAARFGFNRVTVWRVLREEPHLATKVPHPSSQGGFRYEITDPGRLAAVIRARLESNIARLILRSGRPPPAPAGTAPAAGGRDDGDD